MAKGTNLRKAELERRRHHKQKRALTTALGAAILALAAIGLVFLIITAGGAGYNYIKNYLGPDETTGFFEKYINSVVNADPAPFTDISNVNSELLLKIAVREAIAVNGNSGRYAYSDDDRQVVPAADVLDSFKKLFGNSLKPDYHTFTDNGVTFEYNQKQNSFYIPRDGIIGVYTPRVTKISRHSNTVTLIVQYLPSIQLPQATDGVNAKTSAAVKTMIYTLSGSKGNYALTSVNIYTQPSKTSSFSSGVSATSTTSEAGK